MLIRPARADDEADAVALWQSCGLLVPANDPAAEFRFALAGACSDVLLGEENGAVVASAMVGHDGHRGWIYYLAVSPAHRQSGNGRALVGACETWLADRRVPKAQLLVRETNTAVIGFYERLGYGTLPRTVMQKVLGKPGAPAPNDR